MDRTLSDATTLGLGRPESDGKEGALWILKASALLESHPQIV